MADIILSEDQLWTYISCPLQYDLARKGIIPFKPCSLQDQLMKITNTFFVQLMNGKIMSVDAVKKRWDKVWAENQDRIDQKKGLEGITKLMFMYKWAERTRLRILDVMVPYALVFTGREKQKIDVRGEIGIIALTMNNDPEILIIDYGDKHTSQTRVDMNLKYSLWCMAYSRQTQKDIGIHVRNIKHNSDIFSFRAKNDYERLKRTIADVGYCVDKQLFYPREGVMCVNCYTAGACRSWH